MNKTFRTAVTALTLTIAASLVVGSNEAASAAYERPNAKNDSVKVVAGQGINVEPLRNDRVWKASKARVKVLKAPSGFIVMKKRRSFGFTTTLTQAPGTYRFRYRVTDKRGRYDDATVKVTVVANPGPTGNPTPTPQPSPSATPQPSPTATPTPTPQPAPDSIAAVVNSLPVATEVRTGYDRTLFKHWNSGLPTGSGGIAYCDTRDEVLISESVTKATWSGTSCTITGSWYSYYDGVTTTDPGTFDIDHMVPLAEAWDSGASGWTAAQRETYANDQGDPRSLVAVSASSNRGKGDQDPGEWWPLLERCRYAAEWTATKARFGLSIDQTEKDALLLQASQCTDTTVTYTKAW